MGGAVSAPSHARDVQLRLSPRRRPVMLDATIVRTALQDAGQRGDGIEKLSEAIMVHWRQREGGEGVDDAILLSLGVIEDSVRARLLQHLTELGPLQNTAAEGIGASGVHRVSRDEGNNGEGKVSDYDYERGSNNDEDGQDQYLDDFEYTLESPGSSSPLSWADGEDQLRLGRVDAITPRQLGTQPAQAQGPVGAEAPMLCSTSSGTPPVDSPADSEGADEGSSTSTSTSTSSHTTRPTALASPPSHMDSHGSTPVTSPSHPIITNDDQAAGGLPRIKEKGRSSDARKVAEQLNLRLKEDKERSSADKSPRILPGHWKLGQKIGNGSFGQVYVGLNEDTGQFMAVKALPIGGRTGDAETLYREIELMRNLKHPNIVRYLGAQVGVKAGKLFIFTEWMAGGSVSSMLEKFGPLKPSAIRTYTTQLLRGLEYLHDHHIIHRDIKGGNLLVDDKGSLKLADFGASKQLGLNGSIDALNGTLKGTPYFMAPEVLLESHNGRKSDIWSVGGAVLEMLTDEAPWKGLNFASAVALMYHITHSQGPPPLPERMPPLLRAFLLRCFERDPGQRPSARELLSDAFLSDGVDDEGRGPSGEEDRGSGVSSSDSGVDWLARLSSGDSTVAQGDLSDWGIKVAGGSGGGSGGTGGSSKASNDETFELLARALGEREKGKAAGGRGSIPQGGEQAPSAPPGSPTKPSDSLSPVRSPKAITTPRSRLIGENLGRLPVATGQGVGSSMQGFVQAGREGGSLWPMRPTGTSAAPWPASLRVATSTPPQPLRDDDNSLADSTGAAEHTHTRRRNKTRSDDLGVALGPPHLYDLTPRDELSAPSPSGVRTSTGAVGGLTVPRSPPGAVESSRRRRRSSFPHQQEGPGTGLPGLVSPSKAPSPRANGQSTRESVIRTGLTLSRDALRAALLDQDADAMVPSTSRSCMEFSRGGRSSVSSREVEDGAKQGEVEPTPDHPVQPAADTRAFVPFSPKTMAARRDRVMSSASADAALQRKTGQDRLVLPPLDSGMDTTRRRLLSPSASAKATRHADPLTDSAKFQVHRVVHATDVDASWDSTSPRDVRTSVVSAPAGCLDSHSTSVYIESTGAVPATVKQSGPLLSLAAAEAKDLEWTCAKQSCGRLNTGDDDHCGFCATIRGSSGGRGERTIVYTRSLADL